MGSEAPSPILELKAQAKYGGWSDLRDVKVYVFNDRVVIQDKTNPLSRGIWYGTGAMIRAAVAKGVNAVIPFASIKDVELKKKFLIKWVTIKFVGEDNQERTINIVGRKMDQLYNTIKSLMCK